MPCFARKTLDIVPVTLGVALEFRQREIMRFENK